EAKFKDKSISDILEMTIDEAFSFFEEFPGLKRKLGCLKEVGLGYMRTGQSSTTLSGGEAQRVKLASELSKKATGRTLYILDEPTTGLHFDDIAKLLSILDRISDSGNTALIIEHNMDVLKCADWIIDLGPEGGRGGGEVIACGTPEDIAANPKSITGRYLKKYLSK
ncbi:MAG: ATP-binding cassette domain-containing protein, partial [bacterium]|nr:ATP-binding cassette domain-containing protein [bacterium]